MMTRVAAGEADPVEIIVACLKQDDAIGGFVGGRVGRVGDYREAPSSIEIGHTRTRQGADGGDEHCLVTIHVWSRQGSTADVQKVLERAQRAIVSSHGGWSFFPKYTEVRFDKRQASYHGLLRLSVEPSGS